VRRCHAGLDVDGLRGEVLQRLRSIVSIDAAFFATVDPATMLFTSAFGEPPLDAVAPLFLVNEIGTADVNKFTDLARDSVVARTLDDATEHERASSTRSRELMTPLGLGDELRVTLRSGTAVWGVLCLHRADAEAGFSDEEIRLVESVAPHIGTGLRRSVMLAYARTDVGSADVGLVVLDPETFSVVSINATGERMLAQLSGLAGGFHPPLVVEAVARRALAAATTGSGDDVGATPMVRCRAPGGEWLTIHASLLAAGDGSEQVGVVLERAGAAELASLVLKAFDLTAREQTVAELVLRGYSTRQIVDELHISAHTVQDHLKSVFAKFGVGSRRELVASLLSGPPR